MATQKCSQMMRTGIPVLSSAILCPHSFLIPSLFPSVSLPENKPGVLVSKTVTLVGVAADGGGVCNEGLSLER